MESRLSRGWLERDPVTVARELLGRTLVSTLGGVRTSGRIVETEAYLGAPDRAAHTFGGRRTERNRSMWERAGTGYVYFVYGMHHCMNVVAGAEGEPVAVLVRALEPREGAEAMYERRSAASRPEELCSGPAKLCQALAITLDQDGCDLVGGEQLYLIDSRPDVSAAIARGPRIGVDYAGEWAAEPLRFWLAGNPHVSR